MVMIEKDDFFRNQVEQCRSQVERSSNKTDREFWLDMALRWEGLLRGQQPHGDHDNSLRKDSFGRTKFTRRHAA
jgi:hypothetical protein